MRLPKFSALAAACALAACTSCTDAPTEPAHSLWKKAPRAAALVTETSTTGFAIARLPALTPASASAVLDVDDHGHAVGYSSVLVGTIHKFQAVLWQPTGELTPLDIPGAEFSLAFGINESDEIVGSYSVAGDFVERAFHWKNGVATTLPSLTGRSSVAADINELGEVVGWSILDDGFSPRGVVWGVDHAIARQLLPLTPGHPTQGTAINDAGVAAGFEGGAFNPGALVWEPTGAASLVATGALSGINSARVLAGTDNSLANIGAFRVDASGGLTVLRGFGSEQTLAAAMNGGGDVVGYAMRGGAFHPAFWRRDTADVIDLGRLADKTSAEALAVNNSGRAGGRSDDVAVIWTVPVPPPPPTPASLVAELQALVRALDLPRAQSQALFVTLAAAGQYAERGRPAAARLLGRAFILEVRTLVRRGRLSASEAEPLLARAETFIALLR